MALTKTINYIQQQPISLGYTTEINGASGVVKVTILYNGKMGRLTVGAAGVTASMLSGCAAEEGYAGRWTVEGTQNDVNTALNALSWIPKVYDDVAIVQTYDTEFREYADFKGEVQLEISDRLGNFAFVVGDTFKIVDPVSGTSIYTTTRVDTTLTAGARIWGTLDDDYLISDASGSPYKTITPGSATLLDENDLIIDYISDYGIVNAAGKTLLEVTVTENGGSPFSTDTVTMDGSFLAKEPYFSVAPPVSIVGGTYECYRWTYDLDLGTIAQDDNQIITVQLLMKRSENDPLFDGDIEKDKPSYIADTTYGAFSTVRLQDRQSKFYPDEIVRWEIMGKPADCNLALKQIQFYEPAVVRDFLIEVRIISSRTRISNSKGAI